MAIKRILLVDDSPALLTEIRNAIESVDAHFFTASSGSETVEKAKAEMPDIIFMDIVMDNLDGYCACREIRKDAQTRDIPVIFVSTKH